MTKEEIYDEQVNPLMAEIIRICEENKIAMLADFNLGGDLKCTTFLLDDDHEPTPEMLQALALIKPKRTALAAFAAFAKTLGINNE